ncbi:MAG TPA: T6SS immunity protein Tdi1 domain-containing protein [Tepidisphaeraceae bacterium]|jgi:hypothetical protein|nr:T6SS immunity protein Tdi1 domain-containing protein [Tepidisphaeraceae bacterium]
MPSELFRFFDPPRALEALGSWGKFVGRFSRVIGYSAFGDFILVDPESGEHAILLTMSAELEPTGYVHTDEFTSVFMANPGIIEQIGKPALLAELEHRLGPLASEEVYFPVPYPFLGGSGTPETFDRGNVWTFAELVGQSHGLK